MTSRDCGTSEGVKIRAHHAAEATGMGTSFSISEHQATFTLGKAPVSHIPAAMLMPDLADLLRVVMKDQLDSKFAVL